MKTVVSASEVAHLWANKIQEHAKVSAGHFYFRGDNIYSYGSHFLIAKHYEDVILFTTRTYSNTTAKHIGEVRGAISHKKVIKCYSPEEAGYKNHEENINFWLNDIVSIGRNLAAARKPQIYLAQIEAVKQEMNVYLNYFEVKLTKAQELKIAFSSKEEFLAAAAKATKAEQDKLKTDLRNGKKVFAQYIAHWRTGSNVSFFKTVGNDKNRELIRLHERNNEDANLALLRVIGEEVETSKGIKLPIDIAKRYYQFYISILSKGGCNGDCNYKILHYDITSISSKGLTVGCHTVSHNEIENLATQLNWVK